MESSNSFSLSFSPSPSNSRSRYSRVQSLATGGIQTDRLGINEITTGRILAVVRPKVPTISTNGALGSSLPGVTQPE